jgi:hypothetical protein
MKDGMIYHESSVVDIDDVVGRTQSIDTIGQGTSYLMVH